MKETNNKSGIPFYKVATLGTSPSHFISAKLFQEYKNKYPFPKKGELLISCSGTVGKCLIYDGCDSYYQDSNIVWIENRELEVKNDFLFLVLQNFNWNLQRSTTIKRLYRKDLEKITISFPKNKDKQDKIIRCFQSLERLIKTFEKRNKLLEQHKKRLIEKLLPEESVKYPGLRFAHSAQKKSWKHYTVGNLFKIQSGYAFPSNHLLKDAKNNMQVVRIGDINCQNTKKKVYVAYTYLDDSKRHKYLIKRDDLLLGLSGSAGFQFLIWNDEDALLNQRVVRIRAKEQKNQRLLFLLEALLSAVIRKKGCGQNNNLSQNVLKKTVFFLPEDEELENLLACLASLDRLIKKQREQLCLLVKYKASLIEQVFSSINGA